MLTLPPDNQPVPTAVAGLQLVSQATILGIPFVSTAPASGGQREAVVDWAALEAKCVQRLHKLGVLPLSAFGRGFASAAYAVSSMLYLAEYMGAPPSAVLQRIGRHLAATVDHRADPLGRAADQQAFCGIAADFQLGSPCEGGLGVLSLLQHVVAQEAKWAVQLVQTLSVDNSAPWVVAARTVLRAIIPAQMHPVGLLARRLQRDQLRALPPALQRMFAALRCCPQSSSSTIALRLGLGVHRRRCGSVVW